MHFTTKSGLLFLAVISIFLQVRCDIASNQAFTFPRSANSSSPDVSDLIVHVNDNVIVEYIKLPSTTAVGIDVRCYESILDAMVNETAIVSNSVVYTRQNLQHCKYFRRFREL